VTTFTWLHLTDMHAGQPQFGYDVELVIGKIVADIAALVKRAGDHLRPDVVLFTGDLAYSGTEYLSTNAPSVDSLLSSLWDQWPWPDRLPRLAPTPGNHDLAWQPFERDQFVLWSTFHAPDRIVRDQFFTRPNTVNSESYWLSRKVTEAFAGYTSWLAKTRIPTLTPDRIGQLPGEYATTFETEGGARVGILALNTAYYDLPILRKDRPKLLALHTDQLAALGFADWYQKNNICLTMTHHPPSWIHEMPRERLRQQYFVADQIALHLCGHLHELQTARYGIGWEDGTLIYQGRSLFGIEEDAAGAVRPSLGYTIGQLQFTPEAEYATLRMYPRQARFDGGEFRFQEDGPVTIDRHLKEKRLPVRPLRTAAPVRSLAPRPPSLEVLLDGVVDRVWHTLAEPSGQSVFLYGPPRYGKTTVVQAVQRRLDRTTRVAHRDLVQLRDTKRGLADEAMLFIRKGVAPLFGKMASDFDDLSGCLSACLGDGRCILVIDAYHLITGSARQEVANELRHCMEAYRPQFRVLLLSRRPLTDVAPIPQTTLEPSSFQTMLRQIELQPLGAADIATWVAEQDCFRNRLELVSWMHRYTGGHPWLLSTLLQALSELATDRWPTWTRDAVSDDERAHGLHASTGPAGQAVRQLTLLRHLFAPEIRIPFNRLWNTSDRLSRCGGDRDQTDP
jgi:calcineurin-like phosphoesterase family protein/ATPase family protein associated with various cellular activities (AAA)